MRTLAVRQALVPIVLVCGVLLSGCVSSQLSYSGSGQGVQNADVECDGGGTLRVQAEIDAGQFVLGVQDAEGEGVAGGMYDESVDSEESVSGAAGTWSLSAVRGPDFSGNYEITLDC